MVQVDQLSFNLSSIFRAHVNFEQIIFTVEQLNKSLPFFNFGPRPPKTSNLNLSEYHPAERKAIELWEDKSDTQINKFLNLAASEKSIMRSFGTENYDDNEYLQQIWAGISQVLICCLFCDKKSKPFLKKEVNNVMFILINICLIAHALSRPYNEPEMPLNLYRGEHGSLTRDSFLQERKKAAANQKLIFSNKFTSTSTIKAYVRHFGKNMTYYHQSPSLNPIAKDISHLMLYANMEAEVLIPPDVDFLYAENEEKGRWDLQAFRAINHEKKGNYRYCDESKLTTEHAKMISSLIKRYDGENPIFMHHVNLGRRKLAGKKAIFFTLTLLMLAFLGTENILSIFDHSLTGLFDRVGRNGSDHTSSCGILAGIFLMVAALLSPACKSFIRESRRTKLSFFPSDVKKENEESPSRYYWPCCYT